jgi:hypothetical protein
MKRHTLLCRTKEFWWKASTTSFDYLMTTICEDDPIKYNKAEAKYNYAKKRYERARKEYNNYNQQPD